MNIIVAVSNNWCIGKDNELLQPIHRDLKRFKQFTTGNIIICGRTTYESFPKRPLPDRLNIVVTSNKNYGDENIKAVSGIDELRKELKNYDTNKLWVVGGESIYRQLIDYSEKAYITVINTSKEGNKYFPDLEKLENWKKISSSDIYEEDSISFRYDEYINTSVKPL